MISCVIFRITYFENVDFHGKHVIRANYTCYFISSEVKINREYTHIDFSVFYSVQISTHSDRTPGF